MTVRLGMHRWRDREGWPDREGAACLAHFKAIEFWLLSGMGGAIAIAGGGVGFLRLSKESTVAELAGMGNSFWWVCSGLAVLQVSPLIMSVSNLRLAGIDPVRLGWSAVSRQASEPQSQATLTVQFAPALRSSS